MKASGCESTRRSQRNGRHQQPRTHSTAIKDTNIAKCVACIKTTTDNLSAEGLHSDKKKMTTTLEHAECTISLPVKQAGKQDHSQKDT